MFPCKFYKTFKDTFHIEHFQWLLYCLTGFWIPSCYWLQLVFNSIVMPYGYDIDHNKFMKIKNHLFSKFNAIFIFQISNVFLCIVYFAFLLMFL